MRSSPVPPRLVGVIDIGKTNAKFAVVDLKARAEIAVRKTPNNVLSGGLYPHFDIEGLWSFLCNAMRELNAEHPFDALSVTTHGASAALVDEAGELTLPVLDYEFLGPDALDVDYAAVRPDFSESFTPPLPGGLNVGKQLFWQARQFPEAFARTRWILTYPQYWAMRLTGIAASEITSIGCHTDLWDFREGGFSSLVESQGWAKKLPPVRPAADILGPVRPELATALRLRTDLPVHSGIHDSNASLLPHVLARPAPFSVVSTGTWVIVCSPGGALDRLDPSRDSFSNIDALGNHVPSARFMGGREFSMLTGDVPAHPSEATVNRVLEAAMMLWPSVVTGSGPFPERQVRWSVAREELDAESLYAVVSFYLALTTAECLALTGARGDTIVEGPFAANPLYLAMLEAATGRSVIGQTGSATGTAIGAALLADIEGGASESRPAPMWRGDRNKLLAYAEHWRQSL